ncbi:UNVERIFIED_CONTAM: hypothetical protein Sradi_4334100 [Sesamum radiatum]|uniref:Ankyrin repeat family protein n=1 Tax=Sesamum radiatum TaxID=300843 RepID=A0AAW2NNQ3_SESRA
MSSEKPDYLQWRRTDALLKGWILCSLNDNVVPTVTGLKTSREVWVELENKFRHISGVYPAQYGPAPAPEEDLKEYLPLHKAALRGDWEATQRFLERKPGGLTKSINIIASTALHIAVATGKAIHFVQKLVAEMPPESLAVTNIAGDTALITAAAVGNMAAATILVAKKPDLLYIPNKNGQFPVQIAALYARKDVLQYLISVTRDDFGVNPYAGLCGLKLVLFVIEADYLGRLLTDIAVDLVKKYPELAGLYPQDAYSALEKITEKLVFLKKTLRRLRNGCDMESMAQNSQAVFQRLHAMLWKFFGQLGVIKRITKKSLLKRQALELVKLLCKEIGLLLSFDDAKDIYFRAIMLAAKLGIHEVVEEIVENFPSAFYFRMSGSGQYIAHVVVKNRSERVYNLIYQMSDQKYLCAGLVDSNGNNLLHFAGQLAPAHKLNERSGAALQMQHELQWYKACCFENNSHVYLQGLPL